MLSKWADVILQLTIFDQYKHEKFRKVEKKQYSDVRAWRTKLVSMMSIMHGMALAVLTGDETTELVVLEGLDEESTRKKLDAADLQDRVFLVFQWMQQSIIERHHDGGLNIPPPILGRVFQEMSTGMLGFQQCRKIQDTPFPFPYMQICLMSLMVFNCITPFFVHEFCKNPYWAFCFSTVAVAGFTAINEVSIQLEDPFGDDDNDLPIHHYQQEFNRGLIQISMLSSKEYAVPKLEANIAQLYEELDALGHDFDAEPILPAFQTSYQTIEPYVERGHPGLGLCWAPNVEVDALRGMNKGMGAIYMNK